MNTQPLKIEQDGNYAPLSWKGGIAPDGTRTASVTCVNGHGMSLSNHTIDDDGIVSPSIICPHCEWHEFIQLIGWEKVNGDLAPLSAIVCKIQEKTMQRTFDEQAGLITAALSNRSEVNDTDEWLTGLREKQAEIMTLLEHAQGKAK